MRAMYGIQPIRIVIVIAAVLVLAAVAFGVQREGLAPQERQTAISLNAPTSFPEDI